MAINDILEIGRQGLAANRQALQTTSHNIANANTPNYSRQRPVLEAHEQSMNGGARIGGGVEVAKVIRVHDDFVQNHILEESKSLGSLRAKSETLRSLEGVIQHEGSELSDLVTKFFGSLRDASVNPELATSREAIGDAATAAANGFRKMSDSLDAMKKSIDGQITHTVEVVNSLAKELAELNGSIATVQSMGQPPNELLDRRDAIQRELSQKLGYEMSTDERNNVNIVAPGVGVLVQGNQASELVVTRTPENGEKTAGSLDIFLKDVSGTHQVTRSITEGELGGFLHVRDKVISPTTENLDRVAFEFAQRVNSVHREGTGQDGVSGRDFFHATAEVRGAASAIEVHPDIKKSHEAIAVGYASDSPGDNRVALGIAEIGGQSIAPSLAGSSLSEGNATLSESINEIVGHIGIHTQRNEELFHHQEAIVDQLENYRQSISGVSLDEEAIHLMQFQTAFNAAAKMMKIGDELLDTVLRIKS